MGSTMTDEVEFPELVLLSDESTPDHEADGLQMRTYAEVIAGDERSVHDWGVRGVGEGKTSVLRQARSLIKASEAEAISVWFNAWQYVHEPDPLVPLALAIAEAVDRAIPEEDKYGKAGRWITLREIGAGLRAVATGFTLKTPVFDLSGKEIVAELDRASGAELDVSLGTRQRGSSSLAAPA